MSLHPPASIKLQVECHPYDGVTYHATVFDNEHHDPPLEVTGIGSTVDEAVADALEKLS